MGILRSILGFVVVLVLIVNLLAVNVVTVADRTALNADYVATTLEEEGAYATAQAEVIDRANERLGDIEAEYDLPIDPETAVRETLTRSYLQGQVESNLDRAYGYLHGEREELSLSINVTPVRNNVADLVESRIRNLTVGEMISLVGSARDLTVSVEGVTLNLSVVSNMSESPEAYRASRRAFRADIREAVIDRLVESAYESRSNDELLLLAGYNPRAYNESEKERLVRENEESIKATLEEQIREQAGDQIATAVDEQLASLNEGIREVVSNTVAESVSEQYRPVATSLTDLVMVGVEGLTTDMDYQTFRSELAAAKSDLATNASDVVEREIDDRFGQQIDIDEQLSSEQLDQLERARTAVGVLDILVFALPAAALLLVGILFLITRSISTTALGTGAALAIAGVPGFVAGTRVPGMIESRLPDSLSPGVRDLAMGVLEQVAATVANQSLLLIGLGFVLLVAGIVLRVRDGDETEA